MFKKLIKSKLAWFLFALPILYGAFYFSTNRTITWEEEVPLNTGETIWVKRSMPWKLQGGFGNPFDISMKPTWDQVISFSYAEKEYFYLGRANVLWIVVSPSKTPTLVARAADLAWDSRNSFYCVTPHYVQFSPNANGKIWSWPEKIEPWLYGFSANVMATIPQIDEKRKNRYFAKDREQRDATYRMQSPTGYRIDPQFKSDACVMKSDIDMNQRPDWTKK